MVRHRSAYNASHVRPKNRAKARFLQDRLYTFAIWQTWDGGREVNGCKSSFPAVHSLKQIKDKRIDGMIKSIYY